jgi:hypothetical protein
MRVNFDPVRGMIVEREWNSVGDNLLGVANNLLNQRIAYELTRSGCRSNIRATISGGQAGVPDIAPDNWQLFSNEIQEDMRKQTPNFLKALVWWWRAVFSLIPRSNATLFIGLASSREATT